MFLLPDEGTWLRVHNQLRMELFHPSDAEGNPDVALLCERRLTVVRRPGRVDDEEIRDELGGPMGTARSVTSGTVRRVSGRLHSRRTPSSQGTSSCQCRCLRPPRPSQRS